MDELVNKLSQVSITEKEVKVTLYRLGKSFKMTFNSEKQTVHGFGQIEGSKYVEFKGVSYCTFLIFTKSENYIVPIPLEKQKNKEDEYKMFYNDWTNYVTVGLMNFKGFGKITSVTCLESEN